MNIKPSKILYFIPLISMIIGVVGLVLFFASGISNRTEFTLVNSEESITVDLVKGSFVSFYVESLGDMTFDHEANQNIYDFSSDSEEGNISIKLTVVNNSNNTTSNDDFEFEVFEADNDFTEDNHINFVDINVKTEGEYIITINNNGDATPSIGYTTVDFTTMMTKVMYGLIFGFIFGLITLVSFFIIFYKRNNSRRNLLFAKQNPQNGEFNYDRDDYNPYDYDSYSKPKKNKKNKPNEWDF